MIFFQVQILMGLLHLILVTPTVQIQALYPTGQLLDITYYKNLSDALSETNKITNITNYSNIGYPNTQNIYVRVDSQINNECLGLGHHITLNVDRIPIVQPQILRHCDDDQDGIFAFDTTNLQTNLLNSLTNVVVTYSDQNGNPITMTNPFVSTSQTINVKVKILLANFVSTILPFNLLWMIYRKLIQFQQRLQQFVMMKQIQHCKTMVVTL